MKRSAPAVWEGELFAKYVKWRGTPHGALVYKIVRELAERMAATGRRHYGMFAIINAARFEYDFRLRDENGLKITNSFAPYLARELTYRGIVPEGFFELVGGSPQHIIDWFKERQLTTAKWSEIKRQKGATDEPEVAQEEPHDPPEPAPVVDEPHDPPEAEPVDTTTGVRADAPSKYDWACYVCGATPNVTPKLADNSLDDRYAVGQCPTCGVKRTFKRVK